MALDISEEQRRLIRRVLVGILPDVEYLAFGSRLGGRHHRYSDLDVALRASDRIPLTQLSALEEAFAESDLPFRVDIVDLHRVSPEFRRLVEARHIRL